jgi:type IV secretion system protein VirD4
MVEALLSDLVFDTARADQRTLKRLAARLALPEKDMRSELDRVHKSSASPRARHLAGQLKQLVKETFSGVYGNMSEQTEWLANPRFAALVSGQAFRTRELREGRLDVFLNIPMKVLETTPALARCIVGALLNAVYEADGQVNGRVLFLLDEVARLGFMSSLARARDAGRKYGITLVMLYQSEGQLVEQWGEDGRSAWFESVTWRSYSTVADVAQAKVLSEACGEHGVVSTAMADSKGVSKRQPLQLGTKSTSESATRSEQRRRLITPDEILQDMRTDEQIVFVRGRRPLRCGRAIYFRRPEMLAQVGPNRFAHAHPDHTASALSGPPDAGGIAPQTSMPNKSVGPFSSGPCT